uniref:Autophagy protein 5 n=1 Tax=Mucochytrium quahogii TaxID=96639 RepID=A0A7S2RBX8_9STRA|mmetsp:Transcript_11028/g.18063  ORF Transcript_11028/g.18063 Transcript_11028/m.18063 type:complete len:276 (-) Transcript_11028:1773-2600(-)|eukprot:CAMPEP_0203767468 /NCGR_PEP_ID=MMETSP0099_2-20121227/1017_1 /ASSEMBLY_ACC=CAM_ASM_000209 /TAXON_ID=96639 /ORGANISM=" , Strain NY0313808BC1" /LENGTH=275 /DNA_ID=CAMNT_0050663987 /DNA_START=536 /DNA_END=1363 /DNA_ORIENTATION=+
MDSSVDDVNKLVRVNWRGGIPLLIEGEATDFSGNVPTPVFTFASRNSYLPHALSSAISQFKPSLVIPVHLRTLWFEYGNVALPWHYPIGVLFDLCCAQNDVPFRITIHWHAPPPGHKQIVCPELDFVKKDFFHWFKQGMYIRYGSRLPFTEFRDDDDDVLWDGVMGGDVDRYYAIQKRMKTYPVKAVPIRLMYLGRVVKEGKEEKVIVLCKQVSEEIETTMTTVELVKAHLPKVDFERVTVRCQGVECPQGVSVSKLFDVLAHADLFLYICVCEY